MRKDIKVFIFALFFLFVGMSFTLNISALNANFTLNGGQFFNIGGRTFINFTVGAMSENISQVEIKFATVAGTGGGETFIANTNGTNATNVLFTNSSNGFGTPLQNFSFLNTTPAGIIPNGS